MSGGERSGCVRTLGIGLARLSWLNLARISSPGAAAVDGAAAGAVGTAKTRLAAGLTGSLPAVVDIVPRFAEV